MAGQISTNAGAANKGKWDITAAPGSSAANWGGSFLAVPKSGKHVAEACALVKWLTAPKQQAAVFKAIGVFPSNKKAYALPEVQNAKLPYFNDAPIGKIYAQEATTIPGAVLGPKDGVIKEAFSTQIYNMEQRGISSTAALGSGHQDDRQGDRLTVRAADGALAPRTTQETRPYAGSLPFQPVCVIPTTPRVARRLTGPYLGRAPKGADIAADPVGPAQCQGGARQGLVWLSDCEKLTEREAVMAAARARSGGRPTLAEVAARAGVGRGTVSRVINGSPRVSAHTRTRSRPPSPSSDTSPTVRPARWQATGRTPSRW